MRETVRSLRVYFILFGLASLCLSASALRDSLRSPGTIILEFISIGFSLAFLYVGYSLAGLLRSSAGGVMTLLYTYAGWSAFSCLCILLIGTSLAKLFGHILGLLVLWYLLKNVRRLAAAAQVVSSREVPSGS